MKDIYKLIASIIFVITVAYSGWSLHLMIIQFEIQKATAPLNTRIIVLERQVKNMREINHAWGVTELLEKYNGKTNN